MLSHPWVLLLLVVNGFVESGVLETSREQTQKNRRVLSVLHLTFPVRSPHAPPRPIRTGVYDTLVPYRAADPVGSGDDRVWVVRLVGD